jgi:protein TonB
MSFYGLQISFAQESKIYTTSDTKPIYPGGKLALAKFLKDNVKYPEEAKAANKKGTVVVSFIVEKSGALTGLEVINGIGKGCDVEALRIVRKMPKWIPGLVGGKPVRALHKLSIAFPQT